MRSNGILEPLIEPLLLCLAACALACGHLPPPRSRPADTLQAPPVPRPLPPAPAAKPADQCELRLTLPAGTYVRLAILSTSPDLVVRQLGPDGETEELQLAGGGIEPARLSWVTARAGDHRWTVEPRNSQGPPGAHALALEEERPAGPCDEVRLRAERAVLAARRELYGPRPDAAARARALLEPAVADASQAGERHAVLAVQLELARTAAQQRAADGARLYASALGLARELGDRAAEADALQGQADFLPDTRKLESLRAALEIRRQLGDEGGQAHLLYLVGYYHEHRGEITEAVDSYRQALSLHWRTDDEYEQAVTLGELGVLFGDLGESDRAFAYLDVAFALGQEAGDLENQAFALRVRASIEMDLGELQAAHDEYARVHELLSSAGAKATAGSATEAARALEGLAKSSLYMGQPEKARQWYGEELSAFEALELPRGRAYALLGIGSTFESEHRPEKALEYFQQALSLIRPNGLRPDEGLALYDLGRVHRELGQPLQAIADLEAALALEATYHPARQAQIQIELALAYREAGKPVLAEAAFQHAVQLCGAAPLVEAAAQAGLARLRRDRGDLAAARSAIERALAITEKLRSGVVRPDQRVTFLAARRGYFELYVDLLMRLDRQQRAAGHDVEALAASEQARARGLLDLLAKERVNVRQGIPAELKRRETEIGERIARLQTRLWSPRQALADAEAQRLRRELDQAEEAEKELDAEMRRREPAYAAVRTPEALPLRQIQGLLDEQTALLEFFVGDEGSYLFVVTREGLAVHSLPSRRQLVPLVEGVRNALYSDSRLRARHYAQDAYELYRQLLLPAVAELRGKPRLVVAQDGPLYALSFEALLTAAVPDGGPPRRDLPYLIRERSVSYVPSASVLAQLTTGRALNGEALTAGKLFVGFGDPARGPVAGKERRGVGATDSGCAPASGAASERGPGAAPAGLVQPPPLPAARDEVCRIARLFGAEQAAVFLGPEASEENVKASAVVHSARILHFAAHGLLDEDHPDLSGLQLTHAGDSAEDGLLQVREIFNLQLRADLVVLSACQSGLGKEVSGEGLIGMTRAFLYAGASSVVVSLWQVDDVSTADLMVGFYSHLKAGLDRSEALRHAKLELIDRSRYSHPYFWAPFVLVGRS
jgi:CHAT domain-containing protein/Tfp pilus assembly protein PilF